MSVEQRLKNSTRCFALRNTRAHTFSASDDRCVCFFIANAESARQFPPTCASGPLACLPASPLMQSAKIAAGRRNGACLHQSSAIAQNRGFCAKRSGNATKLQAELPLGLLKAQFAATWWSCGDLCLERTRMADSQSYGCRVAGSSRRPAQAARLLASPQVPLCSPQK